VNIQGLHQLFGVDPWGSPPNVFDRLVERFLDLQHLVPGTPRSLLHSIKDENDPRLPIRCRRHISYERVVRVLLLDYLGTEIQNRDVEETLENQIEDVYLRGSPGARSRPARGQMGNHAQNWHSAV
jgi:hypothetical protein